MWKRFSIQREVTCSLLANSLNSEANTHEKHLVLILGIILLTFLLLLLFIYRMHLAASLSILNAESTKYKCKQPLKKHFCD